jgi:outer membrane receptor protein involved in Fe transport
MIHQIFTFLGILLSVYLSGSVPDGTVKGKVSDSKTREPLSGVYVIYGKNLGTTTGADGTYEFEAPAGKVMITFKFVGYEPSVKEVTIKEAEIAEFDVFLEMSLREIDQIVVSANKTEQKVAELSVSMDIIKTSFLSDNHINSAEELINTTPGIEVMDGQASVRGGSGFSYGAGSRVLALIDGLPMIAADAGSIKWQFLPLENLAQVEIIKGASSVLYGSSALNGVINFRTADATNIPSVQFFTEAGFYGKPQNKNWIWSSTPTKFSSASFSFLQKFGKTDIGLSASVFMDEGYRKLNDELLERVNLKIKHFNGKVEGLNYGLNISTGLNVKRDFILWEDADSGALKQSQSTANEFHGTFLAIDPFISYRKNDRYRHDFRMRVQSSTNRLPASEQNNSDALSVYSEYLLWYKVADFINITGGLSENYSYVKSNFFGDHNALNLAFYTQAEAKPFERLKAVAGVRVESYSLDRLHEKIVPIFRAGINWQAADYTFVRASFGQGYRYPAIAEKFASTTMGSIKIIPNPDIIPESGWSTEAGIKQGLLFGQISGEADLSFFFLQNKDMIEFQFGSYPEAGGYGFRATNVEQSRVYGSELEFSLARSFGDFKTLLSGGYTFTYPIEFNSLTNKNTDIYLKYRRKHLGVVSIKSSWRKFDAGVNLYAKSKILNIDEVFLTTDILQGFNEYWQGHNTGYAMLDANLGYKLSEKITISLAVKNLTNTEYMGRPGDIQPQRNFSLRLTGKF